MENNKTPKIRFKGFTDPWEQRKLGEVVGVYDGVHQTPHYTDNGVMFLSVENITTLTSKKFISEEAFEKDYKVYPQQGDVLMTRIGDVGTPNVVETTEKLAFYVSLALLKPNDIDSYFLCNAIQSPLFQKGLKDRTLVTAIPQKINKDEIGKIDILIPDSQAEQVQIGNFFRQLDNLITLHQRKYNKLLNVKKSMLEKMFPKNGSNIPEIRFKGFTDPWEQRKLSDVADVRDGTHASPKYISEGHPLVTSKNVKDGFVNYDDIQYISDEDFDEINKRSKVDVNDVLMGMIGTIGNIALIRKEPDFAIKNVALIKDTKKINYLYLYHFLQSNSTTKQLTNSMDGGTQKFIALGNIRNLDIDIPSDEEQAKLGKYFDNLDHLITLHQRELEKLQNIKKSMLEKMFV